MNRKESYQHIKVAVIGGGTGSFAVLSGLKQYTKNITALVNMVDDGGSTGQLRDELGALPPGDVRQCLVALSNSPKLRDLFNYRFAEGSMKGHPFGNILLSALEKLDGSFADAVETASEVLNITGKVVPITYDNVQLIMHTQEGQTIKGQRLIEDTLSESATPGLTLSLSPNARINQDASDALREADIIVIAPGDIYTSLAPVLIVDGVEELIKNRSVPVVFVSNLVAKPGQTNNFGAEDYIHELERLVGYQFIDYVIFNAQKPSQKLLDRYAHDGEIPVTIHTDALEAEGRHVVMANILAKVIWDGSQASDPLAKKRSFIRHDQLKTALEILRIV